MPQGKRVKFRSRDVARAAREVGALSQHVAELATELRHARENTNEGKRRSPVEVVLDGLTARH
jgi:nitrogen fixation/metabolism regulation signal transduction histidine kinase